MKYTMLSMDLYIIYITFKHIDYYKMQTVNVLYFCYKNSLTYLFFIRIQL